MRPLLFFALTIGCASSETADAPKPSHDAARDGAQPDTTTADTIVDGMEAATDGATADAETGPPVATLPVDVMVAGGARRTVFAWLRDGSLVAGLDAGGLAYSPDGKAWRGANVGAIPTSGGALSVWAVAEHPLTDRFVFAATDDGVLYTEDVADLRHHPWKKAWAGLGVGTFTEKSTFAFDSSRVYVSTSKGVQHAKLTALATWTRVGDAIDTGAIAIDGSGHLFIAASDSVRYSANPGSEPAIVVQLANPGICSNVLAWTPIVDRMYALCDDGLRRFSIGFDFGMKTEWQSVPIPAGANLRAIAGFKKAGAHVLYAAGSTLLRTDDARADSVTWTETSDRDPHFAAASDSWWLWSGTPPALDISSLAVDDTKDVAVLGLRDGIAITDGGKLHPLGRMAGTIKTALVVDPTDATRVGSVDATYGFTQLEGAEHSQQALGLDPLDVRPLAVDPMTPDLYVGGGKTVLHRTFARGAAWESVGDAFADPIIGVSVGRDGADSVLLAVTKTSIARKKGDGAFVDVTPSGFATTSSQVQLAWSKNGSTVFLHDRFKSIWRSKDSGATWSKLIDASSSGTSDVPRDFIAVDPTRNERLYVVLNGVLNRVVDELGNDAAASGATVKLFAIGSPPIQFGAMAVDKRGRVFACERDAAIPRLFVYEDKAGFSELTTEAADPDARFAGSATRIWSMAIGNGETTSDPTLVYLAGWGSGITRVTVP